MHVATVERNDSLLTRRNFHRTRLRKGGHPPRPAGVEEDRKEGTTDTVTPFKGFLLRQRNTS